MYFFTKNVQQNASSFQYCLFLGENSPIFRNPYLQLQWARMERVGEISKIVRKANMRRDLYANTGKQYVDKSLSQCANWMATRGRR